MVCYVSLGTWEMFVPNPFPIHLPSGCKSLTQIPGAEFKCARIIFLAAPSQDGSGGVVGRT